MRSVLQKSSESVESRSLQNRESIPGAWWSALASREVTTRRVKTSKRLRQRRGRKGQHGERHGGLQQHDGLRSPGRARPNPRGCRRPLRLSPGLAKAQSHLRCFWAGLGSAASIPALGHSPTSCGTQALPTVGQATLTPP